MDGHDNRQHHGPPVHTYYLIFGCLAVLTVVTVAVSRIHMPVAAAVTVALLVAISKASLVATFFMHLKYDARVLRLMCLVPTILTLMVLIALMPDVGLADGRSRAGAPLPKGVVLPDDGHGGHGHGAADADEATEEAP